MTEIHPNPQIDHLKQGLREQLRLRRKVLAASNPDAGEKLAGFVDQLGSARLVAGYWPAGSEMDVRPLMQALAQRGIDLALPVVVGKDQPLEFRRYRISDPLQVGPTRNHEPLIDQPFVDPDLILVPLLGFDAQGHRLGQGGGFYDRTLEKRAGTARFMGIAFRGQQVDKVPVESFDQPLSAILTEDGLVLAGQ